MQLVKQAYPGSKFFHWLRVKFAAIFDQAEANRAEADAEDRWQQQLLDNVRKLPRSSLTAHD